MDRIIKSDIKEVEYTNLTPIEIALGVDDKGRTTAKKLYKFLELDESHYSRWAEKNITKNEFAEENIDFKPFAINGENLQGGRPTYDYKLSASFAKKLAMGTHNEKGEAAKKYFIKIEEKLKRKNIDYSQLSPETKLILQLSKSIAEHEIEQKQLEKAVNETKEEVQSIRDTITINPKAEWRKQCNRAINAVAKEKGNYEEIRNQTYEALRHRAGCRPMVLINNLKKRAKENGMAKSKIEKLNILDVLENDKRLREIYIIIVKQLAIKNNIKLQGGNYSE